MHHAKIGPFAITFTPDGVELHTSQQTDHSVLSYTECYQLLETLYQRREELYRKMFNESYESEGAPPQFIDDLRITYTVNDESLAVASWDDERQTQEAVQDNASEDPKKP